MQRTQIYLPEELRKEVDRYRYARSESMAEYTRKALEDRIKKEKRKKSDLEKLADDFIGSSTKTAAEIQQWLDEVREGRRLADEVREERLQKALQKALKRKQ